MKNNRNLIFYFILSFLVLFSLGFGTFSYWQSLKNISTIHPDKLIGIIEHDKGLKNAFDNEYKIVEKDICDIFNKLKIKNQDQIDIMKILTSYHNSLISDYQISRKKQLDELLKIIEEIYMKLSTAAKLNIERSTTSFIFIVGSAFLLSIFLIFFQNFLGTSKRIDNQCNEINLALNQFHSELETFTKENKATILRFSEFESDSKDFLEKADHMVSKQIQSINTKLEQINKNSLALLIWRIDLYKYMNYNEIFNSVTDFKSKNFEIQELKHIINKLDHEIKLLVENGIILADKEGVLTGIVDDLRTRMNKKEMQREKELQQYSAKFQKV